MGTLGDNSLETLKFQWEQENLEGLVAGMLLGMTGQGRWPNFGMEIFDSFWCSWKATRARFNPFISTITQASPLCVGLSATSHQLVTVSTPPTLEQSSCNLWCMFKYLVNCHIFVILYEELGEFWLRNSKHTLDCCNHIDVSAHQMLEWGG